MKIWLAETRNECRQKQFSVVFYRRGFSMNNLIGKVTKENIGQIQPNITRPRPKMLGGRFP
jgi:hypothetical protein